MMFCLLIVCGLLMMHRLGIRSPRYRQWPLWDIDDHPGAPRSITH